MHLLRSVTEAALYYGRQIEVPGKRVLSNVNVMESFHGHFIHDRDKLPELKSYKKNRLASNTDTGHCYYEPLLNVM